MNTKPGARCSCHPQGTIELPKTTFERRIDGWYIRCRRPHPAGHHPLTDWVGPWDTAVVRRILKHMDLGRLSKITTT